MSTAKNKKAPAKSNAKKIATKAPVKKAAGKAPVKKTAGKAPTKKAPARTNAKKAPAKSNVKKIATKAPVKKAAGKVVAKAGAKKVVAKASAKKTATKAPAKKIVAKTPVKKAVVTKAAPTKAPAKVPAKAAGKVVAAKVPAKKVEPKKPAKPVFVKPPVPGKRPVSKDGIVANKDFDLTFLRAQRQLLEQKRAEYLGLAEKLERERQLLIEESAMGDDQFDEDGGEGDNIAVERERAKLLSEQDRQIVAEIDSALQRIATGDYGYSVVSTKPIPRERLEFLPWAIELVSERVGGIGQR